MASRRTRNSKLNGRPQPGAETVKNPVTGETPSPSSPQQQHLNASASPNNASAHGKKRRPSNEEGEDDCIQLGAPPPKKKSPPPEEIKLRTVSKDAAAQAAFDDKNGYWHRLPLSPLRTEDIDAWPGFREVETDPDAFESMLHKLGASGLAVRHVFSLDQDDLQLLPQPILGFMFCFRHSYDDGTAQVESCPKNVWFANQTHRWLCGSNSLINIIFNIPNLNLGDHLETFREFTADLTPAQRGDTVGNFEFLRRVHNANLRKMEMLLGDVALMEEYNNRKPVRKAAPPPKSAKSKANGKAKVKPRAKSEEPLEDSDFDDTAYHYAAYLPIDGNVWKLDGLDRQPSKLDECTDGDWTKVAAAMLMKRIAEVGDEGSASILAICREEDSLSQKRHKLADTVQKLDIILDTVGNSTSPKPNDKSDGPKKPMNALRGPDPALGLTQHDIDGASPIPQEIMDALAGEKHDKLCEMRDEILAEQEELTRDIPREMDKRAEEEARLKATQHDYEPLVRIWLEMLANKGNALHDVVAEMSDS